MHPFSAEPSPSPTSPAGTLRSSCGLLLTSSGWASLRLLRRWKSSSPIVPSAPGLVFPKCPWGPIFFPADKPAALGSRTPGISQSKSGQVDSLEEFSKTVVGAIAIKDRIDGQVSHPDGAIVIRCLQPFECVFVAVQRCIDLSQSVGRNVTFPRDCLQFVCDSECFTL